MVLVEDFLRKIWTANLLFLLLDVDFFLLKVNQEGFLERPCICNVDAGGAALNFAPVNVA